MGQLVARYGLLAALGLGSVSFVSGAAPAPAAPWDHGRNVKFESVGQANGRAVEYALKDKDPATKTETVVVTKGVTKAEAGTLLQSWFKKTDSSQRTVDLVDKAIDKTTLNDAKEALKIAKDIANGDAALTQKVDDLSQKTEWKDDEKKAFSQLCSDLQGKGSADQQKKLSDVLFKKLEDSDLPKDVTETRSVKGGNVVFELKDVNQAANFSAAAVFDAAGHNVVANFGAGNVDKINVMGEDAKTLFKNITFDMANIPAAANLAVQDQPVAQANAGLTSITGAPGTVTGAITAMENTVKKVAAVWYADEIIGATVDSRAMKGAIQRVKEAILVDGNKYQNKGYKLGVLGNHIGIDNGNMSQWQDASGGAGGGNLWVTQQEAEETLNALEKLFTQAKNQAKAQHFFVDVDAVYELLDTVVQDADPQNTPNSNLDLVANAGLVADAGYLPAPANGVNFATSIHTTLTGPNGKLTGLQIQVECVKRLAELIRSELPKVDGGAPYANLAAQQGKVHTDSDVGGYYKSVYDLVKAANGSLWNVMQDCRQAVGAAGAAMDTYKARKFVEDMRFTSNFVDDLGTRNLTGAPGIANYMPQQTVIDLNSIEAEVNQKHGAGGLFEVKFPANIAAGDRFCAIFRKSFINDANGDGANVFNNDETPLRDAAHIVDLTNDYNKEASGVAAGAPNGNGVTALVPDHADAHVTLVLDASSGIYKDENGAKVRQAIGKNVAFGDIITGNPGNNGSTTVVLINRLTNSSRETDDLEKVEGKNRRAVIIKGAIKESATDSGWKTKDTKIDLVTAADGLNGSFWHDKFVNVRTLTLGAQAGTLLKDDTTGKMVYINEAMSGGDNMFSQGLQAEQVIANNGKSSIVSVPSNAPFDVREVIAENKGTVSVYKLGVRELEPSSDKKHDFTAKDGAQIAIQESDIELRPYVEGDKSRIYQFRAEGHGSELSLAGTALSLGQVTSKIINGVAIESSTPENLPGIVEVRPGNSDAVSRLGFGVRDNYHAQLSLDSNEGVNGIYVGGPGTVEILGDDGTSQEAVLKVTGIGKGNGLGYALISNEATVQLVEGHLPIEGNVLVKSLGVGKGTEWKHLTGDMTVKELTTVEGTLDEVGELHLKDLELKKDGVFKGTGAKILVDGNLTDCKGKVDLSGGEIAWKQDLALDNNGEWKLAKVNAIFEGGVGAEESKVSFTNADANKVEFKKGLILGSGSDWKFAGGEVAVGGSAVADNAKVSLNKCKTTVTGDFSVKSKGRLQLDDGSFDVDGKFSVADAEVLSNTTTTVKGLEILNNGKIQHDSGDYTIDGDAYFAGQFDASKNTQGKLKFTKKDSVLTFEITSTSEDGTQLLGTIINTNSENSVEGIEDMVKKIVISDENFVKFHGTEHAEKVFRELHKIELISQLSPEAAKALISKFDTTNAVMLNYGGAVGSLDLVLKDVTSRDDMSLLTRMYGTDLDLKGLPSCVIEALAVKWRKGLKNNPVPELVDNDDGTMSVNGSDISAKQLFTALIEKVLKSAKEDGGSKIFGKVFDALGRSAAEENARGVMQLADSARHTAYNNLDKFLEPSAHYSIWASGFGDIARQRVCGYKVNYDIYGFEAGIDAALNNYWTLGLLGGYGKVNGKFKGAYNTVDGVDFNNALTKCDTKSYFGGVYGMWSDFVQDLEVKFSVLAGHLKFNEKRTSDAALGDLGTKGFWISGNIDATYKHWDVVGIKLGPWASLSFTDVRQKEGTSPLYRKDDIKVNDGRGQVDRVAEKYNRYAPELTVGVAADYDSPFGLLNLAMGYKRDFHKLSGGSVHLNTQILDAEGKVKDAYKADLGKNSNRSGRDSFVAQASYNMEYGPVGIALGIRGQVGDHFKDIAGSVSASYSF